MAEVAEGVAEDEVRELGEGLRLRRASVADAEALAAFNGEIHRDLSAAEPNPWVGAWTRDLALRPHPTFRVSDFCLVEETRSGAIVSSANLISQRWSYGGVPVPVGRVELVGTRPDYRGRGLVRAQMAELHRWSAARDELVVGITGIPYFYRQFGYEMALALDAAQSGPRSPVPKLGHLGAAEPEPYRVRPASVADLGFLAAVYAHAQRRYLVSCVRDEAIWRYELAGRSEASATFLHLRVVETAAGEPVGFLAHPPRLGGTTAYLVAYELAPGVSWLAATPSVLRYLAATGDELAAREGRPGCETLSLWLGAEHPAYQAAASLVPRRHAPYAWYVRVADLPAFLRLVAPALEAHLAASPAAGHTGELKLSFYRSGVRLTLERGRLVAAEPWQPTLPDRGGAGFPDLTFLQLLFGHRSLAELEHAFPDCRVAGDEARVLLDGLFPRQTSHVWPLE